MVPADSDEQGGTKRQVDDAYGIALAALAVSTVVLIASGASIASPVALFGAVLQLVALTVTMRVSGISRRVLMGGLVVMVIVFSVGVASALVGGRTGSALSVVIWLAFVVIAIMGILRRLAGYRRVTLPLVLGLLCIYLLVGHAFALFYAVANALAPPALSQAHPGIAGDLYFSFITLTTVGYGDVAPVQPVVRAAAVLEAILGQLYLVSVVSLAIGRLGVGRSERTAEDEDE